MHKCNNTPLPLLQLRQMKKPLLTPQEQEAFDAFKASPTTPDMFPKQTPTTTTTTTTTTTAAQPTETCLQGRITDAQILTGPAAEKPVYLVTVQASQEISFEPGEAFGIYAPSYELAFGGCAPESVRYVDACSFPKKTQLMSLAQYCRSEESRALLQWLASKQPAASTAYNRLRDEEFLSYRVLKAYLGDELAVPEEELSRLLGTVQPRFYSCCRAQWLMPDRRTFQFCFNVTRRWRPDGTCSHEGLVSSWLERLILSSVSVGSGDSASDSAGISIPESNAVFPIFKRLPGPGLKNPFKWSPQLPPSRPVVMIAAGTGVAPFIGFLDELSARDPSSPSFSWLIFGLRTETDDFIFRREIGASKLTRLSLAVSRGSDPEQKHKKVYVQDIIAQDSELFCRLLMEQEAIVYVCGDEVSMIKGVNEAICAALLKHCASVVANEREAQQLLLQLTNQGRIVRDIWV